jgi:hypothetical protein
MILLPGPSDDYLMPIAVTMSYLDRANGPDRGRELLCPACRTLLAVGWRPGPDAELALGSVVRCDVCHLIVPTSYTPVPVSLVEASLSAHQRPGP